MKYLTVVFIIINGVIYSQLASDYFPQNLGYNWNYKISVLDSLNNPIPESIFYRKDSLSFLGVYSGKPAYYVLSKSGPQETIPVLPYTDTNYINIDGTDGYEYFEISGIDFLLTLIDSSTLNNIFPLLGLFENINGWDLNYKFAQNVNQQYQIISYDTTVTIDSIVIPLRFDKKGKRLQDENISTGIGTFLCKKFVLINTLSYLVNLPPPFPPLPVPIVTFYDTVWVAPGNWIVLDFIPSTNIDLTILNLGEYSIPGLKREITTEVTGVNEEIDKEVTFNLEQNYPNPFNPSTKIKFNIDRRGYVTIKVSDILGNEISTLFDNEINQGSYEVTFNGNNLSSGVYFYTLEFSDFNSEINYRVTRQMLLIK